MTKAETKILQIPMIRADDKKPKNSPKQIKYFMVFVKLGSRPCPGQVQMTTRSTETQPLSQVTKSGPDA